MRRKYTIFIALMLCAALLAGCTAQSGTDEAVDKQTQTTANASTISTGLSTEDMFTDRDMQTGYETAGSTTIALSDEGSTVCGGGAAVEGNILKVTEEGVYILSGSLSAGQIVVDSASDAKVQLVLNGVSIENSSSAAIYVKQADKVFVTTAAGSENSLGVTGEYVQSDDNNVDAVIFSKEDLCLNGEGSLTITAQYGHGVVSKDDLKVTSGELTVSAEGHGLSGKDSVRIAGGSMDIQSGKDGVHSKNTEDAALGYIFIAGGELIITAKGDGIDAYGEVLVEGGGFNIMSGVGSAAAEMKTGDTFGRDQMGGNFANGQMQRPQGMEFPIDGTIPEGMEFPTDGTIPRDMEPQSGNATSADSTEDTASTKGVKAGSTLSISDGDFTIDSEDDSLHSNGDLCIGGGSFKLSSGDDGVHAEATVEINGGNVDISYCYEGVEGTVVSISGGEIAVVAKDDGINAADPNASGGMDMGASAACSIVISGGKLSVKADFDGIDSNGSLSISDGEVYVSSPASGGDGALDCDGAMTITGGTLVAVGDSSMSFGDASTQGVIVVNLSGTHSEGEMVSLKDAAGNLIVEYTAQSSFSTVVISAKDIKIGKTYTVIAGSENILVEVDSLFYGSGNSVAGGMGGHMSGGMTRPEGMQPGNKGTASTETVA